MNCSALAACSLVPLSDKLLQPELGQVWWAVRKGMCTRADGCGQFHTGGRAAGQGTERELVWDARGVVGEWDRMWVLGHIAESAPSIHCRGSASVGRNSKWEDSYFFSWRGRCPSGVQNIAILKKYLNKIFKNRSNFPFLRPALSKLLRESYFEAWE